MPKSVLDAAPAATPHPLAWPYSRRRQLPQGHDRVLYDSSRWLPAYRNGGQFPAPEDRLRPFHAMTNRRHRRAAGRVRGRLIGTYKARPALRTKTVEQVAAERAVRLARRRLDLAGAL